MNDTMTHYMQLIASNQPWNLIIFMAIPVILAEFIAITELYILLTRKFDSQIRKWNRIASIIVGFYFLGIFVYLIANAVIPITSMGEWRGPADVIAVGFYLLGIVPLLGMALLELGAIAHKSTPQHRTALHAAFVGLFLVVAHVAMIFGMLDPTILSM